MARIFLYVLSVGLSLLLTGCASLHQLDEIEPKPEMVIVRAATSEQDSGRYVYQFALMALFAKTAYRYDFDGYSEKRSPCDHIAHPSHRYVMLDMPQNTTGGWSRWTVPGACYDAGGLYFETYVYTTGGVITEAVIAIRGTEATDFDDLKANLSGVIEFQSSEYKVAKVLIPQLTQALWDQGVKKIYLTGHSLGGGIAQQIAFVDQRVSETFVFNTSPVTNWGRLEKNEIKKPDPTIYRIYQGAEFLAYVRNITTRFNEERFGRSDYRFGFVKGSAGGRHSMSHLTCQLAARVGSLGADHHYSMENAQSTLRDKILCPDSAIAQLPVPLAEPMMASAGRR